MGAFYSKAYLSTLVNTGDRIELLIALYEGSIAYVQQAMEGIEEANEKKRQEGISRAAKILQALCEALDFGQEGSLAGSLFSIYNFQMRQLLDANRSQDLEALQSVKSTLSILLNGWHQVNKGDAANAIRKEDAPVGSADNRNVAGGKSRSTVAMTA